jgi:hypothetical protein
MGRSVLLRSADGTNGYRASARLGTAVMGIAAGSDR